MTFKARVEAHYVIAQAAYPFGERLQTLQRKRAGDPKSRKVLVAYSFPDPVWHKLVNSFKATLKKHGIDAETTKTKSGHVSVALLTDPSEDELEKAKVYGLHQAPMFNVEGADILVGKSTPYAYVSIALDLPARMSQFFQYLRTMVGPERIGDFRKFLKNHHPHVSIVAIKPGDAKKAEAAMAELNQIVKNTGLSSYKPEFVLVMENFEVQDWVQSPQ